MPPIIPFVEPGWFTALCLVAGIFSVFRSGSSSKQPRSLRLVSDNPQSGAADPAATANAEGQVAETESPSDEPADGGSDVSSGAAVLPDPEPAGLRILVAEDNPINRKVMQLLLRRLGYEADIAIDGQQAVEMAVATEYDAILMDLHMPRMGGVEATEVILGQVQNAPRVVAVTADVTQQAREECQRVGMAAYLTKPIDSSLLVSELKLAEQRRFAKAS